VTYACARAARCDDAFGASAARGRAVPAFHARIPSVHVRGLVRQVRGRIVARSPGGSCDLEPLEGDRYATRTSSIAQSGGARSDGIVSAGDAAIGRSSGRASKPRSLKDSGDPGTRSPNPFVQAAKGRRTGFRMKRVFDRHRRRARSRSRHRICRTEADWTPALRRTR